jgi:hypothetical protein
LHAIDLHALPSNSTTSFASFDLPLKAVINQADVAISTSLNTIAKFADMRLMERLQAKLELRRLEKRYTRREKRTGFTSDAVYVDGEYMSPTELWNYRHNSDTSTHTTSTTNSYSSYYSAFSPAMSSGSGTQQHYKDASTGIGVVNAHGTGNASAVGGGKVRKSWSSSALKGRSFDDMRGSASMYGSESRYGYSGRSSAEPSPTMQEPVSNKGRSLRWVPEERESDVVAAEREVERRRRRELDDGTVFGYGGGSGRSAMGRKWRGSTIW